jgi:hypothetical protein
MQYLKEPPAIFAPKLKENAGADHWCVIQDIGARILPYKQPVESAPFSDK